MTPTSFITTVSFLNGVDMFRYLSFVRNQTTNGYLRQVLLLEMVARGIKNHFREILRNAKRTKKLNKINIFTTYNPLIKKERE
jgi:predicted HTH transcriptional regulator